jgi:hypothetical protein
LVKALAKGTYTHFPCLGGNVQVEMDEEGRPPRMTIDHARHQVNVTESSYQLAVGQVARCQENPQLAIEVPAPASDASRLPLPQARSRMEDTSERQP